MNTIYHSAGEIRFLFEQIRNSIPPEIHGQTRATAMEGPELKRKQYPSSAYVDQIEKNAVYLYEVTMTINAAIIEYLSQGRPILPREQVPAFVKDTAIMRPQQTMLLHLNFIRHGCSGCQVHEEHTRYIPFPKLLLAGDLANYMKEMEYAYVYFQASCIATQQCLTVLLQNHNLAGSGQLISLAELVEVVEERIFMWTGLCLAGHLSGGPADASRSHQPPACSPDRQQTKSWWQIWK
jgi:hypothetical protein